MSGYLLKIFKETALPGTLQPNSVYLVAPAAKPNYVEMYVTGTSAATVKRVLNSDDVQAMINFSLSSFSSLKVVADIAARDALAPTANVMVLVKNATGDATVSSGAASYVYELATTTWTKVAEYESLDVVLQWANIQGKPTSTVAELDDAAAKRHSHLNKTQLDKIGEDGSGNFQYNGAYPQAGLESQAW